MDHGDDAPGGGPAYRDEALAGPDLDRLITALEAEHGPCAAAVSEAARTAATAVYRARRDDAVMTEIGHDSAEAPPALIRDAAVADAPRYLRFESLDATLGVEVTAADDDGYRTLVGRIDPPGAVSAEIRGPGKALWTAVDDDGAFVAHRIPAGPVSLVLHHPSAAPVATPWLTV